MKNNYLFGIFLLFLCTFSFMSCDNDDEEGRKVTDYKEYILTIASKKVPGVLTSCGNEYLTDVYAVKKEQSNEWIAFGEIEGFEFEDDYEYRIRISETSYLDYSMGEPAWTEYKLLSGISKEKIDSKGLPLHFIPERYYKEHFACQYKYAVESEKKERIEEDLKVNSILPPECYYLIYGTGFTKWMIIDDENSMRGEGVLKRINKNYEEFPASYKILPPEEGQIRGCMEWTFLDEVGNENVYPSFDVFVTEVSEIKSGYASNFIAYLYRDLTEYYKNKYPEAGVKTVVISYAILMR